jgi:DNA polymerase III gamma/tau subunit
MAMLCQDLDKRDPEPCGKCDNCKEILNEQSQAFTERDAASNGSTDAMRAIVAELPYMLANASKRIYLIDECQRLSNPAQDVLLKPMEEKKLVVMLCTTEAEKIRGAIRSRCEEYTIKKVTREDILPRMKMILNERNVQHEDDAVLIVIDRAEGHVRNVLNSLEMVSQLGPITVDSVREYLHLSVITVYYQILLHLDAPLEALDHVRKACEMVAPDEVASGLAEAAMNCYRMARKCYVDFSYVDKRLADEVYSKYQDNVLRFAKYFSDRKNVTRLSLELDVLSFSLNAKSPVEISIAAPPVIFVAPVPTLTPAPVQPAPVSAPAPTVTAAAPTMKRAPLKPSPSVPAGRDPHSDPSALSPLEETVANQPVPRGRSHKVQPPIQKQRATTGLMEPQIWSDKYRQNLKK